MSELTRYGLRGVGALFIAAGFFHCALLARFESAFVRQPTPVRAADNCTPEQPCFSPCVQACTLRCKPSQLPTGARMNLYANGDLYVGRWTDRLPDGPGLLVQCRSDRELSRYEGEFRAGKREGRGVLVLSGGARIFAEWRGDVPQGRGELVEPDGTRISGEFASVGPGGVFRSARGERSYRLAAAGSDAPTFEWVNGL